MTMEISGSPFSFLSALDGSIPLHRQVLSQTRESELAIASHMVAASKVSLLYAYSGNGKSSFINAGLIPFFVARGYAVFRTRPRPPLHTTGPSEAFKHCVLSDVFLPEAPSEDYVRLQEFKLQLQSDETPYAEELAALLGRVERFVDPRTPRDGQRQRLRIALEANIELGLYEFVGCLQRLLGVTTPILFVCDQFEELFVHFSNTALMESFVHNIGGICRDESLRCQFVFSMREDWVGSMIEFRKEIPDIFGGYFKLAPLRRSTARPAIQLPLERHGFEPSPELMARLLDDLCTIYSQQQLSEFSAVKLMRSDETDPYLELPALQVVLDAIWRTRKDVKQPFTVDHYNWLGSRAQPQDVVEWNPAMRVLSDYLGDFLTLSGPEFLNAGDTAEARLDIVYLLTDRRAHRRALTGDEIVARLSTLRPKALELPTISRDQLAEVLKPLVEHGLIRRESVAGGDVQYELAHDFAVREVVRRWNILEDRRANEVAYREKIDKEINRRRLALLFRQELVTRSLLLLATGCLAFSSALRFVPGTSDSAVGPSTTTTLVTLSASVAVVVLGLGARLRGVARHVHVGHDVQGAGELQPRTRDRESDIETGATRRESIALGKLSAVWLEHHRQLHAGMPHRRRPATRD
jgi:hypothetical protein